MTINAARRRSAIKDIMIPPLVEEIVMNKVLSDLHKFISVAVQGPRPVERDQRCGSSSHCT